jgi:hypothetical protein
MAKPAITSSAAHIRATSFQSILNVLWAPSSLHQLISKQIHFTTEHDLSYCNLLQARAEFQSTFTVGTTSNQHKPSHRHVLTFDQSWQPSTISHHRIQPAISQESQTITSQPTASIQSSSITACSSPSPPSHSVAAPFDLCLSWSDREHKQKKK